jgi:hypothetical protein
MLNHFLTRLLDHDSCKNKPTEINKKKNRRKKMMKKKKKVRSAARQD